MDHSSQMNFLSDPSPPLLLCLSSWFWCPKLHFQIVKWLLTQFRSFPCFSCWDRSHFPCDTWVICHKMYCGCGKKMLVGELHFVTDISFWSILARWDLPLFAIPSSQIHATSCTKHWLESCFLIPDSIPSKKAIAPNCIFYVLKVLPPL